MAKAGWTIDNGALKNARGEAFAIDLLVLSAQADIRAAAAIWSRALERLGVALTITAVDPAQYNQRTDAYDFDMTPMTRVNSLSPGNEQRLYWGAIGVETPGTRNLPGFNSPAVEAMIDRLVNTTQSEDLALTAQALDRALMAGRYVIPLWFADRSRIAFDRRLHYPADRLPVYGDWAGFHPDIWWYQE
jgi:peptide/nickel transport system substrate-binding protein